MEPLGPISADFAAIRKGLNPAYSYLIVKNERESGQSDDFSALRARLSRHGHAITRQACYREKGTGKLLLVVEIDPDQADHIKSQILNNMCFKNFTVYFYGRD